MDKHIYTYHDLKTWVNCRQDKWDVRAYLKSINRGKVPQIIEGPRTNKEPTLAKVNAVRDVTSEDEGEEDKFEQIFKILAEMENVSLKRKKHPKTNRRIITTKILAITIII